MSTAYYLDAFETAFGWVGLLASDLGIRRATLPCDSPADCAAGLGTEAETAAADSERFADLRARLVRYFDGRDERFDDVPLDLGEASEFYRRAWAACRTIPRGETRSYKWLAQAAAGNPNAARAAGGAMANNRVPIIVPCHRVVGTDGALRGFGSGQTRVGLKRRLLDMESAAENRVPTLWAR